MRQLALRFIVMVLAMLPTHIVQAAERGDSTSLLNRGVKLDSIVVYGAHTDFGVTSVQMSAITLSKSQIQSVPVFMGEPDVLKTLQKFPGVQSSNDGAAGIFVRGGDYDQNYITLDCSALYNAEHLKGYVSAINPDVVQSINFYRGGFPARYGSRLSSVVDVGIKTGDFHNYHGLLSVGTLSARAQIEGPIFKGKTSFNLAGRVSYFGLIARPVLKKFYDKPDALQPYENMRYYDINAKVVHQFNDRHRLSGVFYYGKDVDDNTPSSSTNEYSTLGDESVPFDQQSAHKEKRQSAMSNNWHNLVSSLYWTARFNDKIWLNTNLSFSQYKYRLTYENTYLNDVKDNFRPYYHYEESSVMRYNNDISDLALTADAKFSLHPRHLLRGGIKLSTQRLTPATIVDKDSYLSQFNGPLNYSKTEQMPIPLYLEDGDSLHYKSGKGNDVNSIALYIEDDYDISTHFKANYGVRIAAYGASGKGYFSFEPRVSISYMPSDRTAIKASYTRMAQGIHRLMSGNLVMPSDIWVPITNKIPLMTSDMWGCAFNYKMPGDINVAIEGYYKTIKNVLEYQNGASFTMSETRWQDIVAVGDGRAFGAELLVERRFGNTTGWLSYTWSKSLRKFDREGNVLNSGKEFYSAADRRNNFSLNITHHFTLSRKVGLDLTGSWSYQTVRRGTIPYAYLFGYNLREYEYLGQHGFEQYWDVYAGKDISGLLTTDFGSFTGSPLPIYSFKTRNDFVLPSTHHLDIQCVVSLKSRLGESSFGLSLYNVYNRKNVSNIYVGHEGSKIVLKGLCPFPFMPSLFVSHKF